MNKTTVSLVLASLCFTSLSNAKPIDDLVNNDKPSLSFSEEVNIIGSKKEALGIVGSAHYIAPEELEKFVYSDIQRIVRQVPGVSLQVEDGYGLRPNISIRGVATERSGRITLLEDNVLIAPAPYSAPSAYYFPTAGRMSAFEVVKGPAAITQGPYTIGGALNMVSTPIPDEEKGQFLFEVSEDSTYRVHATYGGQADSGFGYLLETHQWQSDGFQTIDRSNTDTGLDVEDYTVKLSYAPEGSAHSVELKLQYAEQDSNQSYLGLTDADFGQDAYRRYGLSEFDNITTEHKQAILRYKFELSDSASLTATAYNNKHERNWFKTEGIDLDGSESAQDFSRTSWANIIQSINSGEAINGITASQLQTVLDGSLDTVNGSIQLRANNREYYSRGIQFGLNWLAGIGGVSHDIEMGLRYHEDEEDRLQRNSTYHQENSRLVLDDLGELGNAGNRIQEAQAWAFHIYDRIEYGDWVFTPGLRYENIDQMRTRFSSGANRIFRDNRENDTNVFLPGFGALYNITENLALVSGIHKGFTAPSNSSGVKEEKAINYEFGLRFNSKQFTGEVIAFLSDYDNILGECTSSSGTNCEIGEAFNGDAATVKGLEISASANLLNNNRFRVPLTFSYTYIDSEFDTDIADTNFFGDVSAGDPIPYIPENQLLLSLGLEQDSWGVYVSASYIDEVCTRASCGNFQVTDDSFTLDVSGNYQLNDMLNVFAKIENLTEEEDILGRQPYGARPNKARTASLGLRLDF